MQNLSRGKDDITELRKANRPGAAFPLAGSESLRKWLGWETSYDYYSSTESARKQF